MSVENQYAEAYEKHKNLKIAADSIGIPWQTLYVKLKEQGVAVTGDKSRYGSETDRFAARAESDFIGLVPKAIDVNEHSYQPKVDFIVHGVKVDVKASSLKRSGKHIKTADRWAFYVRKQDGIADFFVMLAYGEDKEVSHVFLIPGEIARNYSTISISARTKGKWWDYEVRPDSLAEFFDMYAEVHTGSGCDDCSGDCGDCNENDKDTK